MEVFPFEQQMQWLAMFCNMFQSVLARSNLIFILHLCVCVCLGGTHMLRAQGQLSWLGAPCIMWVLGAELRWLGLATSTFAY